MAFTPQEEAQLRALLEGSLDKKISQLSAQGTAKDTDTFVIVDGVVNKKAPFSIYKTDIYDNLPGLDSYSTGIVTRSDWNATYFGSVEINYTVKTGTFIVGEAFTSGSHGGNIAQDTGTKLILSDVFFSGPSGNTGLFVIGNVITGVDSGATATCNSNTENVPTLVTHNLATPANQLKVTLTITYNSTIFNVPVSIQSTGNSGFTYYNVSSNAIKVVVGDVGWKYMLETFVLSANITTQEAVFEITVVKLY